ncbi:hypothetical protein C8Q74DRAFT_1221071 [Fomes fomentarius]|nr:hypothetical protein C8Q74DRAFT_1221071 [Fomes fomentarius]
MLLALILAAVQSLFLWIPTTSTQSTEAVCQKQFDWVLPHHELVHGDSDVSAAHSPDWIYDGPQDTDEYGSTAYPEPIPDGTAIPAWAFLDVTRSSIFNITAAKALAMQHVPDVTANSSLSTSSTTDPLHSLTAVLSVTTAIAPSSTSGGAVIGGATGGKRSGSIIAPIVGGCVGGALGILAIGAFAFYISLRYRKAGKGSHKYGVSGAASAEPPTSISHKSASIGMLYDANDPRTFPPPFIAPNVSSSEVSSLPAVRGTAARVGNEPLISFYKGFPQL